MKRTARDVEAHESLVGVNVAGVAVDHILLTAMFGIVAQTGRQFKSLVLTAELCINAHIVDGTSERS